jgi:hemerythrin superfamily protein
MNPNEFRQYMKEFTEKALKESDVLKEMWKNPSNASQVKTMLEIMANDQEALKQMNNTMRIALDMEKRMDKLSKSTE